MALEPNKVLVSEHVALTLTLVQESKLKGKPYSKGKDKIGNSTDIDIKG